MLAVPSKLGGVNAANICMMLRNRLCLQRVTKLEFQLEDVLKDGAVGMACDRGQGPRGAENLVAAGACAPVRAVADVGLTFYVSGFARENHVRVWFFNHDALAVWL